MCARARMWGGGGCCSCYTVDRYLYATSANEHVNYPHNARAIKCWECCLHHEASNGDLKGLYTSLYYYMDN